MLRTQDKRLFLSDRLRSIGQDTIPPWATATPPIAGYIAWYDASDSSTITLTSGKVSTWADKTATFNLTQGTAAARPAWPIYTPSGLSAMFFDFTDALAATAGASDITSTYFAVASIPSLGESHTIFGASADDGIQVRIGTTGELAVLTQDTALLGASTAVVTTGRAFVVAAALTATDCTTYVGITSETDAHAQATTAARTLVVGQAPSVAGSEFFRGWIGELIMYDSTLTAAQIVTNIQYLADKWEIAL